MKRRNISKKKAKQRLKHPQRQSNRKYGTWDKISTRSMNKSNNNTVQINTTIQNNQHNRNEETGKKDIKSPVLKYDQRMKQWKSMSDKSSMLKMFLFLLGSIGTRNSIIDSGTMIPLLPIYENHMPENYQQLPEYKIDF